MNLTRSQWLVLDSLADGSEPLEEIYADWAEGDDLDPRELLEDILVLSRRGYVVVRQAPLPGLQTFRERDLSPEDALAVVGDLRTRFAEFRSRRNYTTAIDGVGVPMGVYVEATAPGRTEWLREEYAGFHHGRTEGQGHS